MTDKTPDQWTQQFMPSLSEWKGAFAADVTKAVAQSKVYTDAQVGTVQTAVQANTTAIAGNTSTLAATTRNPATATQDMGAFRVSNMAQATANTDGARLDQVGWQQIGAAVSAAGANAVAFTLPAGYNQFKIGWQTLEVASSSAGSLYLVVSSNNAVNYDLGNNYSYSNMGIGTGISTVNVGTNSTAPFVIIGQSGAQNANGELNFFIGSDRGWFINTSGSAGGVTLQVGSFAYNVGGPVTNLLIGIGGGPSFVGGKVRLLGWKQ